MSYQNNNSNNSNNGGYQPSSVHVNIMDEQDSLENLQRRDSEGKRFRRNRLLIKSAGVATVLAAVGWMASAALSSSSSSTSSPTAASMEMMGMAHNHNHNHNSCDYKVIVDESGITQDGPGSDGVCNDKPVWYHDQLIDHNIQDEEEREDASNKWTQKCFVNDEYFRGPGYPIFYIMGGEDDANCLLYPFVTHNLARIFGGLTIECEHRFYGKSQPLGELNAVTDLIGLLTPDQAIADYARFLQVQQNAYECSTDRSSPNYCPVVTVGASYPGFLAAMMRLVYPDLVDITYASSAPLPLYAQNVDPSAYFDKVSTSADFASSGCANAVKATLLQVQADLLLNSDDDEDVLTAASRLGICTSEDTPLPPYITSKAILWHEVEYLVAARFADFNMANYPPSPTSETNQACNIFQNTGWDANEKMSNFWRILEREDGDSGDAECYNFYAPMPGGPRSTVYSADWTGGGPGLNGLSWDFQCCTDLVVQTGYGPKSMFPTREWTLEELTEHCQYRFGVTPTPTRMVDNWHFDDLVGQGASRIVFTNGLNDGWSVDSYTYDLSPSIIAINMPNGAHRSDLDHHGPRSIDTEDVKRGHDLVLQALTRWMTEVKAEMHGGEVCP